MRRGLLALLAVLAGVLIAATAAYGAGSTSSYPPVEVIRYKGEVIQTTRLYEYKWNYYSDSGWVHTADTAPSPPPSTSRFPKAVRVQPRTQVNIVISSPEKPDVMTITHYGYSNYFAKHLYSIRDKSGKVIKWGAYFELREGEKVKDGETNYKVKIRTEWYKHGHDSYGSEVRLAYLKTR